MRVGLGNQWEGPIILTLSEIQYTDTTSRSAKRQRNMLDVEGTPRLWLPLAAPIPAAQSPAVEPSLRGRMRIRKSRNAVGRSPASIKFGTIVGFLHPTCFGNFHRLPCTSNECGICSFVELTLSVAANTDAVVFAFQTFPVGLWHYLQRLNINRRVFIFLLLWWLRISAAHFNWKQGYSLSLLKLWMTCWGFGFKSYDLK